MPCLEQFDPSVATKHWMDQRNRRPAESSTRKQQEYFKGVFLEADQHQSTNNPVNSFLESFSCHSSSKKHQSFQMQLSSLFLQKMKKMKKLVENAENCGK